MISFPRLLFWMVLLNTSALFAQDHAHWLFVQQNSWTNKQQTTAGYAYAHRWVSFSASGGIFNGTDNQFLAADQLSNEKAKQRIRSSQTVAVDNTPSNSYLEACNSVYSGYQFRLGFTAFLRRNDTLDRRSFSGPVAGMEFCYLQQSESQDVTFKSLSDETRYYFSGQQAYASFGVATHVGWQFVLLHQRLYINAGVAIPFYYPLIDEPNLNSPFTSIKYEGQVRLAWRLNKPQESADGGKAKVREKI